MNPVTGHRGATSAAALPFAEVDFDGGTPRSPAFGDVYYDATGPAEADRVFLAPACVAERASASGKPFTIVELGFGTGLNFLVAAAATRSRLHFVSFESAPLECRDLANALKPWRREYPLAHDLIESYPPPTPGWHRRFYEAGRVQLSVYVGDVADGLHDFARQQRRGVDAWFLDGFAPSRNPAMWREELFKEMAALSAAGATATTFSAAGIVRRRLAAHGFAVRKVDQRPHKRHSTAAIFEGAGRAFAAPSRVTILGAGLAGAATARALADKGIAVTLVDGGEGVAHGASGIPAAVMHPRLLPTASVEARYRLQAFVNAAAWSRLRTGVAATGALQLAGPKTDVARLRRLGETLPTTIAEAVDANAASELAGVRIRSGGVLFTDALTVDGASFARSLAGHPEIHLATVAPLRPEVPIVRATGANVGRHGFLEVGALDGQIDCFPCATPPRLPIVGPGVFVPGEGAVWAGATYEYDTWAPARASRANADRYEGLFGHRPGAASTRFRGTRAVTSDRLPVVGEVDGVWMNLGHGSHGTISATFGAEIVASILNGEAAPATTDILALLAPDRFRRRQVRRPNPLRRNADV